MKKQHEIREVFVGIFADDDLLVGAQLSPVGDGDESLIELRCNPDADLKSCATLLEKLAEQLLHVGYMQRVHEMVDQQIKKQSFDENAAFDLTDAGDLE